jgi:hypothetical protein
MGLPPVLDGLPGRPAGAQSTVGAMPRSGTPMHHAR